MKKYFDLLRSYVGHAGAYFMFTMLGFVVFSSALGTAKDSFRLSLVFTALVFALLVGFADGIYNIRASYGVKTLLHGVLTVAAFAISFLLVGGMGKEGRTVFFGTLLFALLYLVIAVVKLLCYGAQKRKAEETAYRDLYTPKNLDQ